MATVISHIERVVTAGDGAATDSFVNNAGYRATKSVGEEERLMST
jgi:hypothetical protein